MGQLGHAQHDSQGGAELVAGDAAEGAFELVGAAELMGLAGQPFQTYATEVARLLEALCGRFDPKKSNVIGATPYL